MERPTRRGFLVGLIAAPLLVAGAGAAGVVRRGIAAVRPSARGRTAESCAQCGAGGHTMLDPECPAAPRVV